MEIQTRNLIDIERYTNDIRTQLLASLSQEWTNESETDREEAVSRVASLFDRAVTKALFNHITQEPPADALFRAGTQAALSGSAGRRPGPKPGSKAASERARKAAETRRANKLKQTPHDDAHKAHRDSEAHGSKDGE